MKSSINLTIGDHVVKLITLIISAAAFAGLASAANAYSTSTFSSLDSSSTQHRELRHILVGDRKLDAGPSLPSGVVRSDTGVPTALLFFTPTGGGGIDGVASYDIKSGGWSLDNKPTGACPNELEG